MAVSGVTTNTYLDQLAGLVHAIDTQHFYPKKWLQSFGTEGGFMVANEFGSNFTHLFWQQYAVAQLCTTTAFCVWCQSACAWYLYNTRNQIVRDRYFSQVVRGVRMGATGLSNPMKALAGMEPTRLQAKKTQDGYLVNGVLPWVSNLERGALVGVVCALDQTNGLFALIDTQSDAVRIKPPAIYAGLNGSATVSMQLNNYLLTDDMLISDNATQFLAQIRPGFILLQLQMAHGAISGCLKLLKTKITRKPWLANGLPHTPDSLAARHETLLGTTEQLLIDPYAREADVFRALLKQRLAVSLLALDAAQMLLLGAGGAGYIKHSDANRRWRESQFVALVTPSVAQLGKMLLEWRKNTQLVYSVC